MSDVAYTLKSIIRRAADAVAGKGEGGASVKLISVTQNLTARTVGQTLRMVRLASNSRIHNTSRIYWDDLASALAPTLSIGIAPVNDPQNLVTAVPAALNSGLDLATANLAGQPVLNNHANSGKMLWELLGLAADPAIVMDIYVTFTGAITNITGNMTMDIFFTID